MHCRVPRLIAAASALAFYLPCLGCFSVIHSQNIAEFRQFEDVAEQALVLYGIFIERVVELDRVSQVTKFDLSAFGGPSWLRYPRGYFDMDLGSAGCGALSTCS